MTKTPVAYLVAFSLLHCAAGMAADYYVATDGLDANPGTTDRPFRTIQKAADAMKPGDTCLVGGGVYRQTVRPKRSGKPGSPIRFAACPGQKVILSGTEPVAASWKPYRNKIYQTNVNRAFSQLFVDGEMMVEARWPNMRFPDELWDRSKWARAGKGSRYGKIVDPKLAETGIDWTGARATLNVAHQFFTWTRTVERHAAGDKTFEYARDLQGITHHADKTRPWENDRYYLSGKLEALDAPGEWFLDTKTRTLYLWCLDGKDPATHRVEVKARNYAFEAQRLNHVEISGFRFFATTFAFDNCDHCVVENCHLRYPTYARRIWDPAAKEPWTDQTRMSGSHNTVRRCSLAYSPTSGLVMSGTHNVVEETLIRDICWYGSLRHVPLSVRAPKRVEAPGGSIVRRNTVYNFGNAGICFGNQPCIVEYNHVYNGGLCCLDVSLVYTQLPTCAGSVIRYNWVHGCRTERGKGLGIRGDDQTRRLTVHHNVVWNCGRDGIIVKGDHNRVYNNTVLDIGKKDKPGNYISLHTRPEPKKPWRKQWPLLKQQNANSQAINNAALTITGHWKGTPLVEGKNVSHNYRGKAPRLVNPQARDFRPQKGSPLIDAGREISGITDGFTGKAPDIGAYEFGAKNWRAGITWTPDVD